MSVKITENRVETQRGDFVHVHSRSVEEAINKPVVVFSHGFMTIGSENHGMFLRAACEMNRRGFSSVLFDQFGCGYSDGDFTQFRLTNAFHDLATVTRWGTENVECDGTAVLFGQSLGTAASVLALRDYNIPEIRALVLWNLSAEFETRYPRIFGEDIASDDGFCFERKGYLVGKGFLADAAQYDILKQFDNISIPTLFLICEGDQIGEPRFAREAAERMQGKSKTIVIENANHSFWCQQELEAYARKKSSDWLTRLFDV